MDRHSLQTRIVLFFTVLLVIVQAVGYTTINAAISNNARNTLREELAVGERVFRRVLEQNQQQLQQAGRVLSADFGFREAIATKERGTIASVLANHGDRIGAATMMLVGMDNQVVADTADESQLARPFPFPDLIVTARKQGAAAAIVSIGDKQYQLVVVPVLAPVPIAWVAMGFVMDERIARDLKSLTSLDVSFLGRRAQGTWALLATTLPSDAALELIARSNGLQLGQGQTVRFEAGEHEVLPLLLYEGAGMQSAAVLQRSLYEAMRPFKRLQLVLLLLTLVGIVLAVLGSMLTARGIARPIKALAHFARTIANGDYSARPALQSRGEIGELSTAFNHMIDAIALREERITELAFRDPLTGLPNRLLFGDRLQQAIEQAQRMQHSATVLVLDLDRFRYVNETLGHPVGDRLLKETGAVLQQAMRRGSDTVARLGGDEFAVLLPLDDGESAKGVARSLVAALHKPVVLDGQSVDVSASIGIATFPQHGDDAITLLRHADMAMYTAKRSNSGFALFDARYHEHQPQRLSLLGELRRAVSASELVVFYQPKIELATGSVRYAESLVRWQHPQRGLVPPDQFIPFAEKTGFITAITHWVIDATFAQSAAWHARGIEVNISINISARDLLDPALPDSIAETMSRHGVGAERIWLEITESAIMEDPKYALETLDRLHDMGFTLSIDDFGTGYSSLAYLKKLPVDEIKIDRSFVMGMIEDEDDATIVRSTIDLAHNMGLKVVAEGVETSEMLEKLRTLGCDVAQGYHISRPLPAEKFELWLSESSWGRHPALPTTRAA